MVKGLWYYRLTLIHKFLLSPLKTHEIRMQERWRTDVQVLMVLAPQNVTLRTTRVGMKGLSLLCGRS